MENGEAVYSVSNPYGLSNFTPEQRGWQKVVKFETVTLLPSFESENGVMISTMNLFHTVLEIDAEKFAELNKKNPKYTYLRVMGSGVFVVDWKEASNRGVSSSGPLTLFVEPERREPMKYVKMLSRTKIDKGMARMILKHLGRTPEPSVTQYLNE